jgi:hypothetical protein
VALTDSLISAWELNEASGNATDSHGSNTLTDNNTVGSGTGLVYGTARDFEADTSEYLSLTDNGDLSPGDTDFTFEAWVKPETTSGFPALLSKGTAGGGREYILYLDGGTPRWEVRGPSSTGGVYAGSSLSAGNWYHLIFWHDSVNNQIGIAVNDGTPATAGHSDGCQDTTDPFQLGAASTQSLYWDGLIGPCRYWKGRVLTSGERTQLYNGGAGLTYASFGGGGGGGTLPPIPDGDPSGILPVWDQLGIL